MEPDILLIDEVLSVGDASFESKCRDRIDRFRAAGCTVVLISHGLDQIREMCDEAIWLESGHLAAQGLPEIVIEQYLNATSAARMVDDSVLAPCDMAKAMA
jgi:ABC-type polysaccharide/polyol phosphate transport system ATPase subunit